MLSHLLRAGWTPDRRDLLPLPPCAARVASPRAEDVDEWEASMIGSNASSSLPLFTLSSLPLPIGAPLGALPTREVSSRAPTCLQESTTQWCPRALRLTACSSIAKLCAVEKGSSSSSSGGHGRLRGAGGGPCIPKPCAPVRSFADPTGVTGNGGPQSCGTCSISSPVRSIIGGGGAGLKDFRCRPCGSDSLFATNVVPLASSEGSFTASS